MLSSFIFFIFCFFPGNVGKPIAPTLMTSCNKETSLPRRPLSLPRRVFNNHSAPHNVHSFFTETFIILKICAQNSPQKCISTRLSNILIHQSINIFSYCAHILSICRSRQSLDLQSHVKPRPRLQNDECIAGSHCTRWFLRPHHLQANPLLPWLDWFYRGRTGLWLLLHGKRLKVLH